MNHSGSYLMPRAARSRRTCVLSVHAREARERLRKRVCLSSAHVKGARERFYKRICLSIAQVHARLIALVASVCVHTCWHVQLSVCSCMHFCGDHLVLHLVRLFLVCVLRDDLARLVLLLLACVVETIWCIGCVWCCSFLLVL